MNTSSLTPPMKKPGAEATDNLRVTVVVPTYQRPTWLVGCLRSVAEQTRPPDEIIAVMRIDDWPTHEAFDKFLALRQPCEIQIRKVTVSEPGFLPPIVAGIEAARGHVIAFIDDDAEALPDWLERLLAPYSDPSVAGVGGRYINIENGAEVRLAPAGVVGRFRSCRPFVGNMYRESAAKQPCDVDFFMGGNMSYRREALQRIRLDAALAHDVAFHYEVDLGMQVKSDGSRLIYDPLACIRHFSAPRVQAGMRKPGHEAIYWYNHNALYIAMKHSRTIARWLAVVYSYVVGASRSWGLISAIVSVPRTRSLQGIRELLPAFAGKAHAVRSYFRQRGVRREQTA